jgi:cytochrome c-type biogenesis protein CcmE
VTGTRAFLGSRRGRLLLLLLGASLAVSFLAVNAAGSALSYYVTPEEFKLQVEGSSNRWRVGGRVVGDTVQLEDGRPARFVIEGEHGERMTIVYPSGAVPSLFGNRAFVVAEGEAEGPDTLRASSVIIKHENEFLTATPAAGTSTADSAVAGSGAATY